MSSISVHRFCFFRALRLVIFCARRRGPSEATEALAEASKMIEQGIPVKAIELINDDAEDRQSSPATSLRRPC